MHEILALPRFANRGLIEVPTATVLFTLATYFPDSRIGASLKSEPAGPEGSCTADFPDSRIGASLKRFRLPPVGGSPTHFPDSRIGASLKCKAGRMTFSSHFTSPIRESGPH